MIHNYIIHNDFNDIYPIGTIYFSAIGTSPAKLFGGTWVYDKHHSDSLVSAWERIPDSEMNYITFFIQRQDNDARKIKFYAEANMTFADWIASEYNTLGLFINENNNIEVPTGTLISEAGSWLAYSIDVVSSDIIVNNAIYTLTRGG